MKHGSLIGIFTLTIATVAHCAAPGEELFVRRVWPMLQEKCLACHGNEEAKIKGGLDLRTLSATLKGGESGDPALVVGQATQSPLYLASTRDHEDAWKPMPPKLNDRLKTEQLEQLRDWINAGAPWPEENARSSIAKASADKWSAEDGMVIPTSGGLSGDWSNRKYKAENLWGYQRVVKPLVPNDEHAIDFLLESAWPSDAKPAPPAEPRGLIRRMSFDLTGLPPTPEETDFFVSTYDSERKLTGQASAPKAVEALITRLLASPHYGERMAQHWLDVVRYADSSGFANDFERGNAWRYRDYVIRAFNVDMPYDEFVREQLAGDEMAEAEGIRVKGKGLRGENPRVSENSSLLIASGFLRMGPWELTGMEVAKVARQRFLDDVTNSVGETFMAHSLQCARCHDHKFDPIPTRDYYSIQAVFATTQLAEREAAFMPCENVAGFEERKYLLQRQADHLAMLKRLDDKQLKSAQKWFFDHRKDPSAWNKAVVEAQQGERPNKPNRNAKSKLSQGVFNAARMAMQSQGLPESEYPPKLVDFTPQDFGDERVARKGLERLKWELDRYEPYALAVYDGRTPELKGVFTPLRMMDNRMDVGELEQTCILTGGDPFSPGTEVRPGVLSVIEHGGLPYTSAPASLKASDAPALITGRRLALAKWIANAENPLTTRAIVNRLWLWHFGQALAGNPNNFGSTGKKPTHPKLLDWLAATLVEKGWSIKAMHRAILSSAAYQRSASSAGEGKLSHEAEEQAYAVFKPRRLTAEELRDTMLCASGELNHTLGGVPNRPEINLEAALQPRQVMGTFAAAWTPNPLPSQRHRRSIYALKIRGLRDPFLEVFNNPAPDFSCEARDASNVTPQVFSLFNSEASYARALALAHRALKESKADDAAIARCFQLALGRAPTADETKQCVEHWQRMELQGQQSAAQRTAPPLVVKREAVEENTGEKFSFSETLHANKDYVPDLRPSDVDAQTRALADVCLVLLNSNEFAYVY